MRLVNKVEEKMVKIHTFILHLQRHFVILILTS